MNAQIPSSDFGGAPGTGKVDTPGVLLERIQRAWERSADLADKTEQTRPHWLDELALRLRHEPFRSRLLGWFTLESEVGYHPMGGATPADVQRVWRTIEEALPARVPQSLELRDTPEGVRVTVGILPVADYALLILRREHVQEDVSQSGYGMDTYFFRAALLEILDVMENAGPPSSSHVAYQREMAAFRDALPRLIRDYPGEYIAMFHGQVVDHGHDQFSLATRVFAQYPDPSVFVLIRRATPEERESIYIGSVERHRK